ncbi:metallophosphoesterase [Flammeovirga sp. EKP202]|uniref:metallophosphoesterase family protein n=1 Tax=Flammeovirga sp. EKP202 TaxID=2770592 RepID=UPI00165F7DFB|nr:metallophosphoesterase [Flammeovirga sp. EKP202]MBD0404929.1 metallophosphoesterase [Flammeovirga sp. EKP202]
MEKKYNVSRRSFLQKSALVSSLFPFVGCQAVEKRAEQKPLVSFGLITDSHYAERKNNPSDNVNHYDQSLFKMGEAIQVFNQKDLDFVIHLGDFKDQDEEPNRENTINYLKAIEKEFSQFKGDKFHAIGNHDIDGISKKEFLSMIENTNIEPSKSYYSFDKNNVHFVVLDANYFEDGTDHDKGNFHWEDVHIPKHQQEWLKKDLAQTNYPTLVFIHHTLHPMNEEDGKYYPTEHKEVRKILEESGKVMIVFQGHYHKEYYKDINNIHYMTMIAQVDYSGPENNSYSIIDVMENGEIQVSGFRRAVSKHLTTNE